jgi:PTH1 family peptidyl-tRNA hydrolase
MTIDALVVLHKAKYGIIKVPRESSVEIRRKRIFGHDVVFLKPMDWMNSSGIAVGKVINALDIKTQDIILIHDDMDFDFKDFRIKPGGGYGRHNGVQSVINAIGSKKFARFRIGIGRPAEEQTSQEYVLSKFSWDEQKCLGQLYGLAMQIINDFVVHNVQHTMGKFNRREANERREKETEA